jgi:hypothetical protein
MMAVKCPCGAKLKASDEDLGKIGKCRHCGGSFPIVPWLLCPDCRADISLDADCRFSCKCESKGHHRFAFGGPPGTTWTNKTSRVRYQLCATVHVDGGYCFRASGRLGPWWPIPVVDGCSCTQRAIRPHETSLPFTDVDEELGKTTVGQRDLVFGRNNRLLLDASLVSWPELIGRFSGIAFEHVIYSKGLSLESILAAGVSKSEAEVTWERVSLRRAEDDKRRETLAKLAAAGYTLTVKRG